MRRRLVITAVAATAIAASLPAIAKPVVPVGVGSDGKGHECVYAFSWVPQCVDTSAIGPIGGSAAPHSSRLVCARFPNETVNTAVQKVCSRFGP